MTFMHSALCTVAIAAVIGLPAATASPQTPSQPPLHDHGVSARPRLSVM